MRAWIASRRSWHGSRRPSPREASRFTPNHSRTLTKFRRFLGEDPPPHPAIRPPPVLLRENNCDRSAPSGRTIDLAMLTHAAPNFASPLSQRRPAPVRATRARTSAGMQSHEAENASSRGNGNGQSTFCPPRPLPISGYGSERKATKAGTSPNTKTGGSRRTRSACGSPGIPGRRCARPGGSVPGAPPSRNRCGWACSRCRPRI